MEYKGQIKIYKDVIWCRELETYGKWGIWKDFVERKIQTVETRRLKKNDALNQEEITDVKPVLQLAINRLQQELESDDDWD